MQSVARLGLRNARALPAPSSSHLLARRTYASGPLGWIGEVLSPDVRKKKSADEQAAARRKAEAQGTAGLLGAGLAAPPAAPAAEKPKAKVVLTAAQRAAAPKTTKAPKDTSHKYSTTNFKHSHRKLNKLGNQIAGKPIDLAIVQMQFSEKRSAARVKSMLATAKRHATEKGMDPAKMLVAEAWVNKGPILSRYVRYRSRGRSTLGKRPAARMHVVLKEGRTREELVADLRARRLSKIVGAGYVREDVPLRNPPPMWAW